MLRKSEGRNLKGMTDLGLMILIFLLDYAYFLKSI